PRASATTSAGSAWRINERTPPPQADVFAASSGGELKLAPAVGFEPTTKRLTAARSTTELRRSGTARGGRRWPSRPRWRRIHHRRLGPGCGSSTPCARAPDVWGSAGHTRHMALIAPEALGATLVGDVPLRLGDRAFS